MNIFKKLLSVLIITHSVFASESIFQDKEKTNSLHLIVGSNRSKGVATV